jgi:hypothetical protein
VQTIDIAPAKMDDLIIFSGSQPHSAAGAQEADSQRKCWLKIQFIKKDIYLIGKISLKCANTAIPGYTQPFNHYSRLWIMNQSAI